MDGVSKLEGSVAITNSDIAGNSLMAITYYLTEVTGNILIENATRLEHLSAFVRVFDVGGSVTIRDNPQLFSIVPISMMTLSLSLEICNNARLLSFGDNVPTSLPGRVCEGDCECIPSSCSENLCENGGTCESQGEDGTPHCVCVPGYTGIYCHIKTCESDPCLNGGRCIDSPSVGYQCTRARCPYFPSRPNPFPRPLTAIGCCVLCVLDIRASPWHVRASPQLDHPCLPFHPTSPPIPPISHTPAGGPASPRAAGVCPACTYGPTCQALVHTGDVFIDELTVLNDLTDYDQIRVIEGDVRIHNTAATDGQVNNVFPCLNEVRGHLEVSFNSRITELGMFFRLTRVSGSLSVVGNEALYDMFGLDRLETVGGDLDIKYNAAIASLTSIRNLRRVGGRLAISHNPALNNINALPLQTADRLVVTSNARLSAINGLASLTTLNGSLVLADNPRLVQARGLASLRKVGTSLSVKRNPSLEDLGFLAALAPTFSAVCANGPAAAVPVPFAEWVAGRRREFGFSNKACDGNCSCPPS